MALDLQVIYTPYVLDAQLPVLADCYDPERAKKNKNPELRFLHYHNCAEFCFCRVGEGALHTSRESSFTYRKGDAVLIPAFVPHMHHVTYVNGVYQPVENDYLYVDMDQLRLSGQPYLQQLPSLSVQQGGYHFGKAQNPRLCQHVQEIIDELKGGTELYQLSVQGLLLTLMADIHRYCAENAQPLTSGDPTCILPALRHIMNHYDEEISVEQLAGLCHISPTHLRRQFRMHLQSTPLVFLNTLRLQRSCTLLYATDKTVADIALSTGFGSICNFNRAFKERYGMSASAWRIHAQSEHS